MAGHPSGIELWFLSSDFWLLIGAVAQLGERLLCKQEVVGSIPIGSTIEQPKSCSIPRRGVDRDATAPRRGWKARAKQIEEAY